MSTHPLHTRHARLFQTNRYVYPVLSRRAGGLSLGVNLNPDKTCNFHCIYCQVDRDVQRAAQPVDVDLLVGELDRTLSLITSGQIFGSDPFRETPAPLRRLNDIAFSGDGEPTTHKDFDRIIDACADVRRRHRLTDVKMVLITNASRLHREHVRRGLEILDANGGEIWAKLEAGTDAYFRRIARASVPFDRVLENLTAAARVRPLVIQSLFMRIDGQGPTAAEQEAYCDRLSQITAAGGQLSLVQIYTVARPPAECAVAPLSVDQIDALADRVRRRTKLPVVGYTTAEDEGPR